MAKKARSKKKPAAKRAKKKVAKKKRVVKKRPVAKKAKKKRVKGRVKAAPELPIEPIGRVTHYFPHVKAGAVMIERDGIRVGDTLYFKGHTSRFKQTVESLQVNHQAVTQASAGDEVGIRLKARVREHDLVFKL
jgi:translation elongation factor EF-Tu-like GTPase